MKTILMVMLVLVASAATAVAGYFYGFNQGQTQAQNIRAEFFSQRAGALGNPPSVGGPNASADPNQGGPRGGGNVAARGTVGVIKSVQGNTLQLTEANGSTVNVTLDAQTTIQKMTPATNADLQVGQRVTIQGNVSGNTVAARTIILGMGQ